MFLEPTSLSGDEKFESKFIRIGNDFYITDQNDLQTIHIDLAKKHKIDERVDYLKNNNKDEVDAGLIFVEGTVIRVGSASSSLGIPLTNQARTITLEKLKKRIPKYSVKDLIE